MKRKLETSDIPIRWYLGDIVEHDGELKLMWLERAEQPVPYTEKQLKMRKDSTRNMLQYRHEDVEPVWNARIHAKWRDLNCNAERGLAALQQAKREAGIPLSTEFSPVVKNPSWQP